MKRLQRTLMILLVLVFVCSSVLFLRQIQQEQQADQANSKAAMLAWETPASVKEVPEAAAQELSEPALPLADKPEQELPEEPEQEPLEDQAQFLLEFNLAALREINEDVLGWLHIPDTGISFPLMRSQDNLEYLNMTWDRVYNQNGSIFLEQTNSSDLRDFHTLIYGHNMKNGTMFSQLVNYQDQAFLDSHSFVYIATESTVFRYEIFSAYQAEVVSDTYRLHFRDEAEKQRVLDFYMEQSELHSDLVPSVEDRILTLSTCTGLGNYTYRWVVHTVCTGEFPVE